MSNAQRTYTIRLNAQGKRELEAHFESIGRKGQANLKRIQTSAGGASQGLRNVSRSSQMASAGLAGLGRQTPAIAGLARILGTTALVSGVVRLGTSSLTAAKDFQAAMKRVQGVTRATVAQMDRLEAKAREMGATTQFRATDAADAVEMLAKNGLRYQEIMDGALDATMMMAGALGGELAPSADLVTDLMAQFSLKAGDLAQITDLVTGSALNSKFGFNDLRLAIGQAGGVAGKFGLEIDDFLTALAATSSAFRSGSDAGTSFKTFLQRMTPEGKEAKEAMRDLGLEFYDSQGRMKDLAAIAEELRTGVAGLSEEARNEALARIFGTDAVRTALLLADQGAAGIRDIGNAIQEVSAADQAAIRLEGLQGALLELSAAWEDLQLTWADAGGLDTVESGVRRLTEIIRYLSENFDEVNEVVERVANALVVVLVGRGMNSVIARSVALRVAWIDMANSARLAGSSSAGAAIKMSRAAVAARVLTGALGGPAGLILTAGALATLSVNTDHTQEALERAARAAQKGTGALDDYTEASKTAAQEQAELGDRISQATLQMLAQSRSQLQTDLKELRAAHEALLADMAGDASWLDQNEIERALNDVRAALASDPRGNNFLTDIEQQLKRLRDGDADLSVVGDIMVRLSGVGAEAGEVVRELDEAMSSSTGSIDKAVGSMVAYAEAIGISGKELRDLSSEQSGVTRDQAILNLRDSILAAADAGEVMRSRNTRALLEILTSAIDTERKVLALEAALRGNWDEVERISGVQSPFENIKDSAEDTAKSVESLGLSMANVYGQYYRSRVQGDELGVQDGRKSGLMPLIRSVESSRDPKLAYNMSLDRGRWTGGEQNLTGMTINEIIALQTKMLSHAENRELYGNGQGSSALGAYQITRRTLRDYLMPNLGLNGGELFDEGMQDRMAEALIRRRKGQGIAGLRNEWEGLRGVSATKIAAAMQTTAVPTVDSEVAEQAAAASEEKAEAIRKEREAIENLISSGDERVAQLQFEQSIAGKTIQEQERLRQVFNALSEAKRQGIDVDAAYGESGETLRQVIERQADAISKRRAEEEHARKSRQQEIDEISGLEGALQSAFEKIRKSPDNIMEAFGDMADYISQRLWQLALDPVIEELAGSLSRIFFSGSGAGGGSGLGTVVQSIFGLNTGGQVASGVRNKTIRLPAYASGGLQVGGRAQGKIRGAGSTTSDNILLLGSRDEFMMRARAVDHYGVDFMDQVNSLKFPRFATGGALARSSSAISLSSSPANAPVIGSINATFEAPSSGIEGDAWGREAAEAFAAQLPALVDARIAESTRPGNLLDQKYEKSRGY